MNGQASMPGTPKRKAPEGGAVMCGEGPCYSYLTALIIEANFESKSSAFMVESSSPSLSVFDRRKITVTRDSTMAVGITPRRLATTKANGVFSIRHFSPDSLVMKV